MNDRYNIAYINNKQVSLDVAATIINGKTYIPLKFVATATGETVSWDSSSKTLTMSRSYAIGTANELTYWIHLDTGVVNKASAKNPGRKIGQLDLDLFILEKFDVIKLSEYSSYIYFYEVIGPSATVKNSGQVLIVNDKIVDYGKLQVLGFFPLTNIHQAEDNVLITDGKTAKFLNKQGELKFSYNLTEIMEKDEAYLIESHNNDFMILREYNSQHLIVYDFRTKKVIYVHEVIDLPVYEKEYLIQAGLDRANEMQSVHIITFDKVDNQGNLLFKYKSKKTDQMDTYQLAL
ncbi:copper amine oxidase N-terminal domain-containing protein [Paenibacillaceae bacterium]|nr:copper amine oxidase N-terminal domain-containing protein [Paenibacillaceae bacterium]